MTTSSIQCSEVYFENCNDSSPSSLISYVDVASDTFSSTAAGHMVDGDYTRYRIADGLWRARCTR